MQWRAYNPAFQASHMIDEQYRESHREWKKVYRKKHPEYVRKNRTFVKKSKRKNKLTGKSIVSRKCEFTNDSIRL